jgi:hypothetical protein
MNPALEKQKKKKERKKLFILKLSVMVFVAMPSC